MSDVVDERGRLRRVAAYALCLDADGRLLLTRIAHGHGGQADGRWTLPGGGIEFGEHPADAALRELREETGLQGEIDALAGVDAHSGRLERSDGPIDWHAVRILYRVRITGGELEAEVGGSSDGCAWFSREEIERLPTVPLVRAGLRALDGG